jgi:hypothetical protein
MSIIGLALLGFSFDLFFDGITKSDKWEFGIEKGAYVYGCTLYVWRFELSLYTPIHRRTKNNG